MHCLKYITHYVQTYILVFILVPIVKSYYSSSQVKHSRTSSPSSYRKDFSNLIDVYAGNRRFGNKKQTIISHKPDSVLDCSTDCGLYEVDKISPNDLEDTDDSDSDKDDEVDSSEECLPSPSKERTMSVEYLENEVDVFQSVDDWDGTDII